MGARRARTAPAGSVVFSYNRFVRQRTLVDESWGGIDVELSRRHDLIPNLVETVQGYATHEREVLELLVRAREEATAHRDARPQQREGFEDSVSRALQEVLARVEAYPDLKASTNFLSLQRELPSPRTGSPPRGGSTTATCAPTTPGCGPSRPTWSPRPSGSGRGTSSSSPMPLKHPCQVSIPLDDGVLEHQRDVQADHHEERDVRGDVQRQPVVAHQHQQQPADRDEKSSRSSAFSRYDSRVRSPALSASAHGGSPPTRRQATRSSAMTAGWRVPSATCRVDAPSVVAGGVVERVLAGVEPPPRSAPPRPRQLGVLGRLARSLASWARSAAASAASFSASSCSRPGTGRGSARRSASAAPWSRRRSRARRSAGAWAEGTQSSGQPRRPEASVGPRGSGPCRRGP